MSTLRIPTLDASPFGLLRAGLRWLHRDGDVIAPREPVASVNISIRRPPELADSSVFAEELSDVQVAFAPNVGGVLRPNVALSQGGFQDVVGSTKWDAGTTIGSLEAAEAAELVPLVLVGRRGFDPGEGRGALLSGWHDRTRAFWGAQDGPTGTVLSLGVCEQTGLFRGEQFAFLEWFALAPGPAQILSIPDERTVHSSAVLLQQLNRTEAEAEAIAEAVHAWIGSQITGTNAHYPAFEPGARTAGVRAGRWPTGQSVLFAIHLMNEAVSLSPLLERTDLIGPKGFAEQGPPNVVTLSLGGEFTTHFRHRKTGWLIALHDYRLRYFVGPELRAWLKTDFERVPRSLADIEHDLATLSTELKARTGGICVIQNLISTSAGDRIPNYAWLGDEFSSAVPVMCADANLMLANLSREHDLSVLDSDALTAEYGSRHCPDRAHPDRVLLEAQRAEMLRILRLREIPGFSAF